MEISKTIKYNELSMYIDKMNKGDSNARNEVINYYSKTINKIIEKDFSDKNYNKDDLFQAGMCGLLLALKRYSRYNLKILSLNIYKYIYDSITEYVSNEPNFKKEIEVLPKITKDPMEYILDKDNLNMIFQELDKLPKRHKNIIYLYFYENYTPIQIARIYNTSTNNISIIIKQIIYKIKEQIYFKNIIFNQDDSTLKSFKAYLALNSETELLKYIDEKGINKMLECIFNYIKKNRSTFSKLKKNTLYLFFFENYTINQISKSYNIKYPTIKKIIDECIFDIRYKLFPFSEKNFEYEESFSQKVSKIYKNQLH